MEKDDHHQFENTKCSTAAVIIFILGKFNNDIFIYYNQN